MRTIDHYYPSLNNDKSRLQPVMPMSCNAESSSPIHSMPPSNDYKRTHSSKAPHDAPTFTLPDTDNTGDKHESDRDTNRVANKQSSHESTLHDPPAPVQKAPKSENGNGEKNRIVASASKKRATVDKKPQQPPQSAPSNNMGDEPSHTASTTKEQQKNINILVPRKKIVENNPQSVKRKHSDSEPETANKLPKITTQASSSRRQPSPPLEDTTVSRPPNVDKVMYGRYKMGAWYYAPYPTEFGQYIKELHICEHCLKYTNDDSVLRAHRLNCRRRKPPGRVIYENEAIKVYEVDGREHKLFCQNLCLMSKLFLDHKTLYYDVEGFMFYVLTEKERSMDIAVGYFSKEKVSYDNYNLACIMVLPTHQRKGYGRLLIELSYEISKHEGKIGSPEKPLSSLGLKGYRSYWASILIPALRNFEGQFSIGDLCKSTGIHADDVISTLTWLGLLKFWKKDLLPPLDADTPGAESDKPSHSKGRVQICMTPEMLDKAIATHHIRFDRMIDPTKIIWE